MADYNGSNTYMTESCKGCCPYLSVNHKTHTCATCGNTLHKATCAARS